MDNATHKRKRVPRFTRARRDAFLHALSLRGCVRDACEAVGVGRRTVYEHRERDPEFAAAWEQALEDAADRLEAVAWERATAEKRPSDTLLIFLLKGLRPWKYRDNYAETHDDGTLKELVSVLRASRGSSNESK